MDYTFGLDADALAEFGAKAVVFDAIREVDKKIRIHPYIKVPPAMPPQEGRVAACRAGAGIFGAYQSLIFHSKLNN